MIIFYHEDAQPASQGCMPRQPSDLARTQEILVAKMVNKGCDATVRVLVIVTVPNCLHVAQYKVDEGK